MTDAPFQNTAEQDLILAAVRETDANLMLIARAGGAKTTTLTLIARAVPTKSIGAFAFNKKNAIDLQSKMPPNATCATFNSVGHRAWAKMLGGRKLVLNDKKCMDIFKKLLEGLPLAEKEELWADYSDVMDAVSAAKSTGFLPRQLHPSVRPLIRDATLFFLSFDVELSKLQEWAVLRIVEESFKQALSGTIDYNDQLYMPAIMPVSFESYDLVMTDESQDLSPIQHAMLAKIVGRSRLIAVGDPCQAIYGFRGADEDSMPKLRQQFAMKELFLTLCFRSSKEVVKNARWRAPDMAYRPTAPEGSVTTLETWDFSKLRPGDAIICRNNAPLFSLALSMLRAGLRPELLGGEALKSLSTAMRKLGPKGMPQAEALEALRLWEEEKAKKYKSKDRARDMAACLRVFIDQSETLDGACALFERVITQSGSIYLMTGHKSKGLEYDRVFFLDRHLLRKEGQDANLRYVIETRAKEDLFYVKSEGLVV